MRIKVRLILTDFDIDEVTVEIATDADFHLSDMETVKTGKVFEGEIELDYDQRKDLERAMKNGYTLKFLLEIDHD